ncbi:hypothetical protein Lfu02_77500 [Longispora fulva]|uniref:Uncharacterized protein n=1 Tax=Longispora fulva TaxID=619741 RepID=A0A8J7GCL1_9ACTN|nr:hypothetical protein [Longispora fulva]MBG6136134.1 hypothetical protein [Longispora fulva]GIG63378.1 hypothetical protein Lfu02_77500 [Longispora fulva]
MNEPTDPDHADNTRTPDIDLVPGVPPVPLTVWRTPRSGEDPTAVIPDRLAARLIDAYSTAGDQIIDLTPGHLLGAHATAGGRCHHRAWFTDTSYLTIAPHATMSPVDRPRGTPPSVIGTATAALMVAAWPLSADPADGELRRSWLMATASKLLRPGGCLVLIAASAPRQRPVPEDFTPVVAAARNVSLGYLQHIVAVAAPVVSDEFVYFLDEAVDDEGPHALNDEAPAATVHLRVHADLFVFLRAGGENA